MFQLCHYFTEKHVKVRDLVVVAREVLAHEFRVGIMRRQRELRRVVFHWALGIQRTMRIVGTELQEERLRCGLEIEELTELRELGLTAAANLHVVEAIRKRDEFIFLKHRLRFRRARRDRAIHVIRAPGDPGKPARRAQCLRIRLDRTRQRRGESRHVNVHRRASGEDARA